MDDVVYKLSQRPEAQPNTSPAVSPEGEIDGRNLCIVSLDGQRAHWLQQVCIPSKST